jgi:methionyl-tRNA formyltransferase
MQDIMKIVFFGSSEFAVPSLEGLAKREEVVLVVTQPDRKRGRFLKLGTTPLKIAADKLGIETLQPDNVNAKDSIEYLKKLCIDIFVVVSFGQILSKRLLEIPKLYCLNVHASLLPKYRGAAPINWAILNGEKETGVSIIKMNERMDEGDIILKESVIIDADEDAVTLSKKLSQKGAMSLLKSIDLIKKNALSLVRQNNREATYAPKLKKGDGLIDWNLSANEIYNKVRAFVPWPGCFTHWDKKILKIWKARPHFNFTSEDAKPGTILAVDKNYILVAAGQSAIKIEELQLEGKRRMKIEEFIAGHKDMVKGIILGD